MEIKIEDYLSQKKSKTFAKMLYMKKLEMICRD